MRALTAFLGIAVPTLILVACSGDQPATTAPSTTPSFLQSSKTYAFSLSCLDTGPSTGATITAIVSGPVSTRFSLSCTGSHAVSGIKSFDYFISVTNSSDGVVAQCDNTQPIHSTRPITCGTDPSATLTVTPI
jgi:hypothetical protein